MLKSRRGLLAAGLAVAVVGAIGVASTLNAGAEQVPGDQNAAQAPVAEKADAPTDVSTPPPTLPWGAKPQRVRRGPAGASSRELRAQGFQAASDDHSHHLDFAPKGQLLSRTTALRSEATDVKPPAPAASPSTTTAPATTAPATTSPTTTAPATTAPTTKAATTTAPVTQTTTAGATQPLAATDSPSAAATTPPVVTGGDDGTANFIYAVGSEATTADGLYAAMDIKKPTVAKTDYHSLAELSVQTPDLKQTVEVGWTIDRAVNGDDDPHLFVFHWINGKPTCYNTCGTFVPYKGGIPPGDTLPADTLKKFGIQHTDGAWWIAYDTTWVGYFPDSEWAKQGVNFTQGGYFQAFGEVAASTSCPADTQMGNGVVPASESTSTAARIANVSYINGPAVPNLYMRPIGGYNIAPFKVSDNPPVYSTKSFRYGGPNACG